MGDFIDSKQENDLIVFTLAVILPSMDGVVSISLHCALNSAGPEAKANNPLGVASLATMGHGQ
jgi:type III secretory pathway lipoprotein EscJ